MKQLTYEQRVALQIGELVLEVRRLEVERDRLADEVRKALESRHGEYKHDPAYDQANS